MTCVRSAARAVLLCAAALVLAGCVRPGLAGVTLVTAETHQTGPVTLLGDVLVVGGSLELSRGAIVRGSVYVLDGAVDVLGTVEGDITLVGGSLALGADAVVTGDVSVALGNRVERAPGAAVRGTVREGLALDEPRSGDPDVVGFVWRFGVLAIALLAAGQLAPGRVRASAHYVRRMPAASLAFGFLLGVVGLTLAVFMAFTIVLVPVAALTLLAVALLALVGLAALSSVIGPWLGRLDPRLRRTHPAWTALAVTLGPAVPVVGGLVLTAVVLVGLGSVGLSLQRGVPTGRGPGTTAGTPR